MYVHETWQGFILNFDSNLCMQNKNYDKNKVCDVAILRHTSL